MNAEEKLNNSKSGTELLKRKELKGTPFTIITLENEESFGVMGKHRITEIGSYSEVKKELLEFTWNRVIQVVVIALQEQENINKEIKKQLENEN